MIHKKRAKQRHRHCWKPAQQTFPELELTFLDGFCSCWQSLITRSRRTLSRVSSALMSHGKCREQPKSLFRSKVTPEHNGSGHAETRQRKALFLF
ncbi:hypothetical protein BaRGS_00033247 [Batillaria attramentaria]|uniref:Uncharacterized protein n=1 Tax=Batillaria attramentaria TaxID=370345 RepID=A0ABD0JKT2_9CAEN